jgi:hypothetical protein
MRQPDLRYLANDPREYRIFIAKAAARFKP